MRLTSVLAVLLCAAGSWDAVGADLRAGAAQSDISRVEEGLRINDPVYAKALVLAEGDTTAVIVAMDVTAIGGIGEVTDAFLPALRARIESELGIPGTHVIVNASHNHPPMNFVCSHDEQVARTFDAVRRAHAAMEPVRAGAGAGHEDRIAMNRTLRLTDGTSWTIRHTNPSPPDDAVERVGPMDPEIGVLRLDRLDGTPLAVVFNYACHPYVGVPEGGVTADFPGFAAAVIEAHWGEEVTALFLQGAGGDITPPLYKDVNRPRDSAPDGMMLGLSTLGALRTIEPTEAELRIIAETLTLPRKTDFDDRIAELEAEQAALLKSLRGTSLNFKTFLPLYIKHALDPAHPLDYKYRYLQSEALGRDELSAIDAQNREHLRKYVANIHAMERLARIQDRIATFERHKAITGGAGSETIDTEIVGLRVGDFALITSPAEVLVDVGLNVKEASPFEHTFLAGYTNGYIHYGPPACEYDRGGYEATECLLAPAWQALFEARAAEILERLR